MVIISRHFFTVHCMGSTTTKIHLISDHLKWTPDVYGDRVWVWMQVDGMVFGFSVQLSELDSDMTRPASRTLTFLWRQPIFYIRFTNDFVSFEGTHCESASHLHYYYIMSIACTIWSLCAFPIPLKHEHIRPFTRMAVILLSTLRYTNKQSWIHFHFCSA